MEFLAALPGITARLVAILASLSALIARALLRHPAHSVHIVPLWNYISRVSRRFEALTSRLAAGQLRPRTPRPNREPGKPPAPRGFPTTRAWLLTALRHEAAVYGHQLAHLLEQPEARAFLQSASQAARLLRPLCLMLGIVPEPLRPPRRPRTRHKPEAPPHPNRIPPPPGVSAAQRSQPQADKPGTPAPWFSARPAARQAAPPPRMPELCPRLRYRWPFNQLADALPT